MTEVDVTTLSTEDARKLTERIRYTALSVRDGMEKLQRLVQEAKDGGAHEALGYASWTAYLADTLGSEPLRLPRDQRQELVGYLAGEGMSTRAIAPIVGVTRQQVGNDLKVASDLPPAVEVEESPEVTPELLYRKVAEDHGDLIVDRETGEIVDAPEPRKVIGLDGKSYPVAKPMPSPAKPQRPSADLSLINDVRIYLRALASSPQVAELGPIGRGHLIDALQTTIDSLKGIPS